MEWPTRVSDTRHQAQMVNTTCEIPPTDQSSFGVPNLFCWIQKCPFKNLRSTHSTVPGFLSAKVLELREARVFGTCQQGMKARCEVLSLRCSSAQSPTNSVNTHIYFDIQLEQVMIDIHTEPFIFCSLVLFR